MYLTLNRASRARPFQPALNGASAIGQLFDGFIYSTPAAAVATSAAARFELVEKDDRFEARIDMPGVAKDAIDVQIDGATVRVKAEAKATEQADGVKVLHNSRTIRTWERQFTLPTEVDDAQAEAAYEDGVLTLTLPKREVAQPKRLAIR